MQAPALFALRNRRQIALLASTLILISAQLFAANSPTPSLADSINAILAAPAVSRADWGIDVISLADGRELYAKNADHLFIPASNFKILTTSATFALVGPQYRFQTTVESAQPPDKSGRITGDLFFVGRGDPNLSDRNLPFNFETVRMLSPTWILEQFATQLAQAGVKQISGNIIGDDTFYPWQPYADGWAQDDLQWYYGAPVSALTLNDNMIEVTILPGAKINDPALLVFKPVSNYYEIENKIVTAAAGSKQQIAIQRLPGSHRVEFWGSIPLHGAQDDEQLAVDDPALFAAQLFKDVLQQHDIHVLGDARAQHLQLWDVPENVTQLAPSAAEGYVARTPPSAQSQPYAAQPAPSPAAQPSSAQISNSSRIVLASYTSPPLLEDLIITNKVSQNLHAELDLRLLGKIHGDGTLESGFAAMREFLSQAGIQPEEYSLHDGSGLSREDLVTPSALCSLLRYDSMQPWGPQFAQTLPVAGLDGSLRHRFLNSPVAGRMQAKTGGVAHVRSVSGYASTLSGERVAFSILLNNYTGPGAAMAPTIDSIITAIVESSPAEPKK